MNTFTTIHDCRKFAAPNNFSNYLALLIADKIGFEHAFDIEFTTWRKARGKVWSCSSLLNAKDNYWWHGSYADNDDKLRVLSQNLKTALQEKNEIDTLFWALRILQWGDVYKGCTAYLLDCYEQNILCDRLQQAVAILDGDNYSIDPFIKGQLRMDSGLTKIYSLASARSIILDSRVAAAMTLIATRVLSGDEQKEAKRFQLFACGTAQSSEKKRSFIRGKKVFSRYLSPANQAHHNLIANWLLNDAIAKSKALEPNVFRIWQVANDTQLLRSIEAALFMIGSDISAG